MGSDSRPACPVVSSQGLRIHRVYAFIGLRAQGFRVVGSQGSGVYGVQGLGF